MDRSGRRLRSQLGRGQRVSLRASTFPCVDGEKVVLRVLHANALIPLDQLGMGHSQVSTLRRLTAVNGGLLLVTGPTGSGKTLAFGVPLVVNAADLGELREECSYTFEAESLQPAPNAEPEPALD